MHHYRFHNISQNTCLFESINFFQIYFAHLAAKQIKAIRYELSNPEYLRRGWTVRNVSPFEFDDISDSEEEADVLVPATIPSAAIKVQIFFITHNHALTKVH